jgi:hypothetical protein
MISGIIGFLIADATIQGLVGQNKAGDAYKVYPVRAPQDEKRPYIIVRRVLNDPLHCKPGTSTDDKIQVSIVVYAENYSQCEALSEAVRDELDGKSSGVYKSIWFTTAEDLFDPQDGNSGSVVINNMYRAWVDRS